MPNDLIFLSLAGLFSGISQLINKRLVKTGFSSKTYTVVIMLFNAFLAIPLLFYKFHIPTSLYYWVLVIISITSFAFSVLFGFKAYKTTDVSVVSIVYRLNIVLIAIVGIIFLGERYSLSAYFGLLLIFISSILFAFEGRKLKLSVGVIYALLMAFTGAIASVLDKVILNDFSPYTYAFFNNLLIGLVFAFSLKTLNEGKKLLSQNKLPVFFTAFFNIIAFVIVLVVLERTNVSKTLPTYKAFSLMTPVLLGVLILKERQKLPQKIAGVLLGLIGIFLLY
jgi:transporter family protein